MLEKDASGVEPLYRPKGWNRLERARSRRLGKTEWFRGKRKNESVVFVPATPRSK